MSGLAWLVLAYDRPRCLYVSLASIFANTGIGDIPVYVFIDGGGGKEQEIRQVCAGFDLAGVMARRANIGYSKGLSRSYTRSIMSLLEFGYKEVIYTTDDLLVTTDSLMFLMSAPRDTFFVTLGSLGKSDIYVGRYHSFGNLVIGDFSELFDYVSNGCYVGDRHPSGSILVEKDGEDAVYRTFLSNNGYATMADSIYRAAHFGVFGRNGPFLDDSDLSSVIEVEQEMFSGHESCWLDNAVRIMSRDYSSHPYLGGRLFPSNFEYR